MPKTMHFPTVPLAELTFKATSISPERLNPIILVVDDEALIADTLAAILSRSGFIAMSAYGGQQALEMAKLVSPDLLITDVRMPGMSGIELAITLRATLPECKVLLFSGQATTADLLADARAAGHHFTTMLKPVHPVDLLAKIAAALELGAAAV